MRGNENLQSTQLSTMKVETWMNGGKMSVKICVLCLIGKYIKCTMREFIRLENVVWVKFTFLVKYIYGDTQFYVFVAATQYIIYAV
jgi:hypothetical protein